MEQKLQSIDQKHMVCHYPFRICFLKYSATVQPFWFGHWIITGSCDVLLYLLYICAKFHFQVPSRTKVIKMRKFQQMIGQEHILNQKFKFEIITDATTLHSLTYIIILFRISLCWFGGPNQCWLHIWTWYVQRKGSLQLCVAHYQLHVFNDI
jgi:hypothetical protein